MNAERRTILELIATGPHYAGRGEKTADRMEREPRDGLDPGGHAWVSRCLGQLHLHELLPMLMHFIKRADSGGGGSRCNMRCHR